MPGFYYSGKKSKPRRQDAYSLEDMNAVDMDELDRANRRTMYGRGAAYSAVGMIGGPPGVAVGAGVAFLGAEKKRHSRKKEYDNDADELANVVNNEIDQLEDWDY